MQEETPTQQQSELSMRDYMDLLRRRKAIILQTFMVVFVLGVAITFMAKPVYRTTARILVEGRQMSISMGGDNPLSSIMTGDQGHDINTQLEVLQGERVLSDAYKDADVPPGSSRLDVHQVNGTDVIELIVESSTPTYAERLAKTLPNTYLNYVTGNRRTEIANAQQFADSRLKEENDKLLEAEIKLERWKTAQHITDAVSDRDRRMTLVSKTEGEVENLESTLLNTRSVLARMIEDKKNAPAQLKSVESFANPAIKDSEDKLAIVEAERKKELFFHKEGTPQIKQYDVQIEELQKILKTANAKPFVDSVRYSPNPGLAAYGGKIIDLQDTIATSQIMLKDAQARLLKAESGISNFGALERMQAQLTRDMELHRGAVSLLIKSKEDLDLRAKATHDPVLTIAPAQAAIQVAPKKVNNLVYASMIGIMLGLCFALLQEFLDDRINSPEDARRIVGTPALGYVPMIENEDSRLLNGSRGGGSVLESYRVLRSNVRFAAIDTRIRSILVTSTVPGEGKSVTAYNLAVSMALDGRSVILVDTDLRRPTMHEKAKLSQQPGLTNVLVGHTSFEDAIKETAIPGLRVLTAGPLPPNPAELLNSQAMRQVHQTLKESADIVIFDSPPCLATADAQVLSAETDGVLYVVQFGEAKKSAVKHAIEMLRQARARVLGVVFNKIDLTAKRDAYYYGYYGYYGYYQTTQLEDGRPRRRRSTAEFEALLPKNQQNSAEQAEQIEEPETNATMLADNHLDADRDDRDDEEAS